MDRSMIPVLELVRDLGNAQHAAAAAAVASRAQAMIDEIGSQAEVADNAPAAAPEGREAEE